MIYLFFLAIYGKMIMRKVVIVGEYLRGIILESGAETFFMTKARFLSFLVNVHLCDLKLYWMKLMQFG